MDEAEINELKKNLSSLFECDQSIQQESQTKSVPEDKDPHFHTITTSNSCGISTRHLFFHYDLFEHDDVFEQTLQNSEKMDTKLIILDPPYGVLKGEDWDTLWEFADFNTLLHQLNYHFHGVPIILFHCVSMTKLIFSVLEKNSHYQYQYLYWHQVRCL